MAGLLVFDQIRKSYGDTVALRGVSFDVREGEVLGLLGPNGAGKTTLMRILMDIIRRDSGTITLFGEPHRREHLDRIGYLPEERGLYTKQPVLRVMTYFGTLRGLTRAEARRRSLAWLERIGMPEVAGWRIERLSKGMSQKVQIASTFLADPDLTVLDEPASGLDPLNARLVTELIAERRQRGKTTILSTHQMNQVEQQCDRVALIHRGSLMVYGEVADVRRRYSLPEVRVRLVGALPELPGVERVSDEGGSSWRLLLRPGTDPAAILAALVAAGAHVEGFEKVLAPMEEIFVRVVGEDPA
ncbi:MAG TPA: ATP-binding cassette domain-containing protein [Candidatus Polarisedimenticolaceae bacterium]|nr:ATP-binding cassette domain-containing protein [Candidatus Polarisedimenticolaceae bacterium]